MIARALLPAALLALSPAAAALTQAQLDAAVARPAPGLALPTAIRFADAAGGAATLPAIAAGRPLVLLFADYTCRHVCGPGLVLTAGALHDAGLVPGRDYRLAVIGLDPRDPPAAARAFAARLDALPAERQAARFLRADAATITAATRALGYGYAYDAAQDQFAHDAAVYVFGRDGRLVTLLPELGLRPESLRAALAGSAPPPGLAARVAHLCFGLAGLTGRYDAGVVLALRLTVGAGLLALGAVLFRRRRAARC